MLTYKKPQTLTQMIYQTYFMQAAFLLLNIQWASVLGIIPVLFATLYWLSLLKINVIDKKYHGSWRRYFKKMFTKN